ncbi:sporulation-specific protein 73, partial [Suhomyces tanzawaensis NRRL Y-17324]
YVHLIQRLNLQLIAQHHAQNKHSHVFEVLTSFNASVLHLDIQFDFVIENQRGMKFFGIPLFSNKTLLPLLDPPNYQLLHMKPIVLSENSIVNYPLPDLDWKWTWDSWYILMYNDVDDQGWVYSNIVFNKTLSDSTWKGKYYTGNFVRRRIWVRMRER